MDNETIYVGSRVCFKSDIEYLTTFHSHAVPSVYEVEELLAWELEPVQSTSSHSHSISNETHSTGYSYPKRIFAILRGKPELIKVEALVLV